MYKISKNCEKDTFMFFFILPFDVVLTEVKMLYFRVHLTFLYTQF